MCKVILYANSSLSTSCITKSTFARQTIFTKLIAINSSKNNVLQTLNPPIIVFDDLSDCMLCARQACFALIQCSFLVFFSQFSLLVLKTCVFVRIKLLVELSSTLGVWWTTNVYSINTNAKAIRKELILK